jgi:predicted RNA binding protein YcfA (HicA-like mRNA interferase family)
MKLPRDLSGGELVECLCKHWNYRVVHQEGSHIILQTGIPSHQRLPVPAHSFLKIGTLNAILRVVSAHKQVTKEEILRTL